MTRHVFYYPWCLLSYESCNAFRPFIVVFVKEEYQMHVQGKDSGGEYLCPVCRDRAMEHMLGELQVR